MSKLLCSTGLAMIAVGGIHVAIFFAGIRPWEGVSGLRKASLFFVSTGLTVWSMGWIRGRRPSIGWWDLLSGYALAISLSLEVFLIAMQSWLGLRSHFNHDSSWSTGVEMLMLAAIFIATIVIVRETFIAWHQVGQLDAEMQLAIRWGLLFLCISCAIGFGISFLGWKQIYDGGSPETFGQRGVFKFPHGATIHTLQTLPIIAFLSNSSRIARLSPTAWAILAHVFLLTYAIRQTACGWDRLPVDGLGWMLLGCLSIASLISLSGIAKRLFLVSRTKGLRN